jgi:hypothetical protein
MIPPWCDQMRPGSLPMSLGRITIVSLSPYFPIGEYLTRCEVKRRPNDGFGIAKVLYLVRFAGRELGMLALPPRAATEGSFNAWDGSSALPTTFGASIRTAYLYQSAVNASAAIE